MTLVFPRTLPGQRFRPGSTIALERQLVMAPTRGGLVQVADVGASLWKVRYTTVPVAEAKGLAWEAWLASMRGGARTFRAVHPFRRTAIAYPNGYGAMTRHGGGSFDGSCTLQAVAVALDTVTLSGLPSTFQLSDGDLLSFVPSGSRQALHRVVEGGTASAGVLTVAVEPTIRPGFTLSATVALASPWFKAVLDQSTVAIDWQVGRIATVSFDAWQTLA
jgi:hypothetical protein